MVYVVEVEYEDDNSGSYRELTGPFSSRELAKLYVERNYGAKFTRKTMVRDLHAPLEVTHIHPNQTTIQDHIGDIHDHVG